MIDIRKIDKSVYFYAALSGSIAYFALWIASAAIDGTWVLGQKSLSDLGISENQASAVLFNAACIFSGLMGMVHGHGWFYNCDGKCRIGGIFLALSGLSLALIGVFTLDYGNLHNAVSFIMGVFACLAIATGFVHDYLNKRKGYMAFTLVIAAIFLISVLFFDFNINEPIIVTCSLLWIPVNGYKVSKGLYLSENARI